MDVSFATDLVETATVGVQLWKLSWIFLLNTAPEVREYALVVLVLSLFLLKLTEVENAIKLLINTELEITSVALETVANTRCLSRSLLLLMQR